MGLRLVVLLASLEKGGRFPMTFQLVFGWGGQSSLNSLDWHFCEDTYLLIAWLFLDSNSFRSSRHYWQRYSKELTRKDGPFAALAYEMAIIALWTADIPLLVTAAGTWELGTAQLIEVPCSFSLPSRTSDKELLTHSLYGDRKRQESVMYFGSNLILICQGSQVFSFAVKGNCCGLQGLVCPGPTVSTSPKIPPLSWKKVAPAAHHCVGERSGNVKESIQGDRNWQSFPREKRLLTCSPLEGVWSPLGSITRPFGDDAGSLVYACLPHWRTTAVGKATRAVSQYWATCFQEALASHGEFIHLDFFCCDTPRVAGSPVHNVCCMGAVRKPGGGSLEFGSRSKGK